MLRAVSAIYIEGQALELLSSTRRDVYKLFRTSAFSTQASASSTVLTASSKSDHAPPSSSPPPPRSPPPPPPTPPRRAWVLTAAAAAITASLGGIYYYSKIADDRSPLLIEPAHKLIKESEDTPLPIPSSGESIPRRVQFLLVGAGTASFAAMRAIRSARPDAHVLMVGDETELPYMRPPLSKELWREPDLATRAPNLDGLTFRQWNGRRRTVAYEPTSFYTPVEKLGESGGGASVARGWKVTKLDVARHEAELTAPGCEPVLVKYDKCLVATGVRPRRAEALRAAAAAGRSVALRGVRDVGRLARALERPDVTRVAVLGGGFLASELSAALAERLKSEGREVLQVFREQTPMAGVLPPYLATEAANRLKESGVTLLSEAEVVEGKPFGKGVALELASGEVVQADLVVECVGSEVDDSLPQASRLELHPQLGGLLVNAELQARSDVYAAGDVACFYDVILGRRRVEHHDHAVVSGRLAGENMAHVTPAKHYTHQSMFWSDLGPQLGYEAIGIIDSQLSTVGVFSADAVTKAGAVKAITVSESEAMKSPVEVSNVEMNPDVPCQQGSEKIISASALSPREEMVGTGSADDDATKRRYERGVVFYLRDKRVVGVLLWNLFNRMHVARQVLAQGEFEDLFEVAKLFTLHEDD